MAKRTENQAINALIKIFINNKQSLDRIELFSAIGHKDDEAGRNALHGKLSMLRKYKFIDTIYDQNKVILGISLTSYGEQVLKSKRNKTTLINTADSIDLKDKDLTKSNYDHITLEYITKVADLFSKQNPSWEWKLIRKELTDSDK